MACIMIPNKKIKGNFLYCATLSLTHSIYMIYHLFPPNQTHITAYHPKSHLPVRLFPFLSNPRKHIQYINISYITLTPKTPLFTRCCHPDRFEQGDVHNSFQRLSLLLRNIYPIHNPNESINITKERTTC
jgi:hypothetical protein